MFYIGENDSVDRTIDMFAEHEAEAKHYYEAEAKHYYEEEAKRYYEEDVNGKDY